MVNKWIVYIGWLGISLLFMNTCLSAESSRLSTWLTVQDVDLRVKKGSALDFEKIFNSTAQRVGKWEEPYLCAPMVFTAPHGFVPPKKELEKVVSELKSRGYNLVRIHFLDHTLMKGARKDFDFNRQQADRIFYFLYLLKMNSIDYMIDAATSWNGAYGDVGQNRFKKKYNLRLNVHFNSEAQAHWKKMVTLILGSINPYTGRRVLSESSLIAITTLNEMGLGFNTRQSKNYPLNIKYKFQRWLRLKGYESITFPMRAEASSLMNEFLVETERKTLGWMEKYLRDLGYQGKVTAYNNGKSVQAMGVRQDLELISIHDYYDHPSRFIKKGSQIKNNSSIASELPYIQYMSLVRELGKPFVVDEYNQPYWNQWRREAGIALASYASFQGWQAICRYANPIVLKYQKNAPQRQRAIYPFSVGMDPIARAGEVLSALLFRRGDVAQGDKSLGILFKDADFISSKALMKQVSRPFTKLSLLTSVGVVYNQDAGYSDNIIPFVQENWKIPPWKIWKENLRVLDKSNLLYRSNRGDVISSTGEILLNPDNKKLKVITPKTEAIVYDQLNAEERLSMMTILEASGKSVLSISSLDNNDLNTSTRILIVFATDARNSASQLNLNGTRILKLGRLPVQIKSQSVLFSVENQNASKMQFYALNLQGERVERLNLQREGNNKLLMHIDLSKLKNGPTTFFELVM